MSKTIARYGRVDLLCLDELGYMELDRRGTELLFQVFTEREERSAVAIARNEPYSGWTKTFTDPRLCAAIVDRLTFAAKSRPAPSPTASHTRANSLGHEQLFKWRRRAPPTITLDNEDLATQQLLEHLLKRADMSNRPQRLGIQQKRTFILADDWRDDERTLEAGQLECSDDSCSLANVEHIDRSTPSTHAGAKSDRQPGASSS